MDIAAAGKVCMVNGAPRPGSLVHDWNEKCSSPDFIIRPYDRLMTLNNETPAKGKEMCLGSNIGKSCFVCSPALHEIAGPMIELNTHQVYNYI